MLKVNFTQIETGVKFMSYDLVNLGAVSQAGFDLLVGSYGRCDTLAPT